MARVLVVDDDAGFRATAERMLRRLGHDVRLASDGHAALLLFRTEPADVVLMDILMPGADGIETMEQLEREAPGTPVIATSGGGVVTSDLALHIARRRGAFSTLPKPFSLDQLQGALNAVAAAGSRRAP